MKWSRRIWNPVYRGWYLLAMYSGLRAQLNRLLSLPFSLDPRLKMMNGYRLDSSKLGALVVFVNARGNPLNSDSDRRYGLISIRQIEPRIGPLAYRYLCWTSHFGRGHIEVAFYESNSEVSFYSVRNIAQSNAQRLGFGRISKALKIRNRREDETVIHEMADLFGHLQITARHAEPAECLKLAVNSRLLRASSNEGTLGALHRKYHRLHATLD